jgi:hypothetical protein
MRRRDFIKGIVGSATVWPLAARAQRVRRLGTLFSVTEADAEGQARVASKAATSKLITVGVAVTPAGCGPMRQN